MIRALLGAIVFFAVLPTTLYLTAFAWEKTLWHVAEWAGLAASVPAGHEYIFRFDWWVAYIGEIDWWAMSDNRPYYRLDFWWWPGSGESLYTWYLVTLPFAMLLLPVFYFIPPIIVIAIIRNLFRSRKAGGYRTRVTKRAAARNRKLPPHNIAEVAVNGATPKRYSRTRGWHRV